MSHKFHGRGSGRKKLEKRMKKIQDEEVCTYVMYMRPALIIAVIFIAENDALHILQLGAKHPDGTWFIVLCLFVNPCMLHCILWSIPYSGKFSRRIFFADLRKYILQTKDFIATPIRC